MLLEGEAKSNAQFREEIRAFMRDQKDLHDIHFKTREKVIAMEARAQGAWWLAAKVAAIASAFSGLAAWIGSVFFKGGS